MYVCLGGGKVSVTAHVEVRGQLKESVLPFYLSLGYKDQTQVPIALPPPLALLMISIMRGCLESCSLPEMVVEQGAKYQCSTNLESSY